MRSTLIFSEPVEPDVHGRSLVWTEFRLAVIQLKVTSVKADNLSRARGLVKEAAGQGSKVVLLPVRIAREAGAG